MLPTHDNVYSIQLSRIYKYNVNLRGVIKV